MAKVSSTFAQEITLTDDYYHCYLSDATILVSQGCPNDGEPRGIKRYHSNSTTC